MEQEKKMTMPGMITYMKNLFSIQAKEGMINYWLKKPAIRMATVTLLGFSPLLLRSLLPIGSGFKNHQASITAEDITLAGDLITKDIGILDKKLNAFTPKSFYLVINTASNEFSLYRGTQRIKSDRCSTGSYILLKTDKEQQWMFKTPKGEFRIQGKTTSPVWRKPDWAFIEQGLPVPSANHSSRFEYGVLGDYALSLGHGYLIHGTLYQRFLGLPVTHGCVRLNDENLELVYKSLSVGSKVYIY